jgi:hypothetical protein
VDLLVERPKLVLFLACSRKTGGQVRVERLELLFENDGG